MSEDFIPILFKILFGFIILNIVITLTLLYIKRQKMYQLLVIYWPTVLVVFVVQAVFQEGNLAVALAGSTSVVAMIIFSMIGFHAIGRTFPLKFFVLLSIGSYPMVIGLHYLGYDFTTVAMPAAMAAAAPLLYTFFHIMFIDRKTTTPLQKVLGGIYLLSAIHCINFALFRMVPGTQLWGWIVAYAIYDMLAILLPSIALEEANRTENTRLQSLVKERTAELNSSLKENEGLVRVLLHDISNPLSVIKWYLQIIHPTEDENGRLIEKIKKSQNAIESIVANVKDLYSKRHNRSQLNPVPLEECFHDVSFIFSQSLEKKNVSLKFNNALSPDSKILADRTSFTHSVLSNLVSNGIKFSDPNSEIEVNASEDANNIFLEIKDSGPGISQDVLNSLLHDEMPLSSDGSMGEKGTGFGLSIVKSFVDSYGGQIEFDSRHIFTNPDNHGTSIRITLNKA
jgi:signal transduction histidine kinase